MQTNEKIKLIEDLVKHYRELSDSFDQIDKLFGGGESKFFNSVWNAFDAYTRAVEKLTGDHFESISWFLFDNECGKRGLICGLSGEKFEVKTVGDLVKFIELST